MRIARFSGLVLLMLGLGACNHFPIRDDDKQVFSQSELRVFHGPCLGHTESASLLAPVVSSVLTNTLTRFGAALRRLGTEDTYSDISFRNLELAPGQLRCIQIVKGVFNGTGKPVLIGKAPNMISLPKEINLSSRPDLFVELWPMTSANREFLTLQPTLVEYHGLLKNGRRTAGVSRKLTLQISFHPAGKAADDKSAVGTTVLLGNISLGTIRDYRVAPYSLDAGSVQSLWFPTFLPAEKAGSPDAQGSARSEGTQNANNPQPDTLYVSQETRPISLTVVVAETRPERPVMLFLADVFDDTSEDIKGQLELLLLSEKRQQARDKAEADTQNALIEHYKHYSEAEAKRIDYCALSSEDDSAAGRKERLKAANDLFAAQVKANLSARSAGLSLPYSVLVEVSDTVPTGCP